ncbi:MAG TPA: hypothetical protein VEM40_13435 [Nitrospirota bacterium]|nr:hypothetical protein [Nitrospirota bacterium]
MNDRIITGNKNPRRENMIEPPALKGSGDFWRALINELSIFTAIFALSRQRGALLMTVNP